MDNKREARAEGGRRFQREGAITAKDLDMAMVVLVTEPIKFFVCCLLLVVTSVDIGSGEADESGDFHGGRPGAQPSKYVASKCT